jgi:type IV secretion system protein VirB2
MIKKTVRFILCSLMLGFWLGGVPQAHASSGGAGLPYEAPLASLQKSVTGPVASGVATIALVACVGVLLFGGEINGLMKTLLFVVLGASIIVGATNFISFLGGSSGADIRSGPPALIQN